MLFDMYQEVCIFRTVASKLKSSKNVSSKYITEKTKR